MSKSALPLDLCTDEVLSQVATSVINWCGAVVRGTLDDRDRTPVSEESKEAAGLVARMKSNEEFHKLLEAGAAKALLHADFGQNVAEAIFWFVQGWRAAQTALDKQVDSTTVV